MTSHSEMPRKIDRAKRRPDLIPIELFPPRLGGGEGPGIRNAFVISAPASRLPIAEAVKGASKLLTGDECTVLPKAFARIYLGQIVARPVHDLGEPTLRSEPR